MDPSTNYVPNNPQFGVQLECNWSATLPSLQTVQTVQTIPTTPSSSTASNCPNSCANICVNHNQNDLVTNNSGGLLVSQVTQVPQVPQDELTTCWSEDMGSFTLPLDLEPLPSLFPFSPCSGNSNSYKQDLGNLGLSQHNNLNHPHNQQVFSLRGEAKQPAEVADVLLSLKHAVVHPGQETYPQTKCENQHLYHPQVLLSPGGYASGICDQSFNAQSPPMFPSMSVNVSMNMTMHGYHPSNYPSSELSYPQVQWNPTSQVSTPMNYQTGLLSPGYTGATYSFTADFRPPPTQSDLSPPFKPFPTTQPPTTSSTRRKHTTFYDPGDTSNTDCGGGEMLDANAKPNVCRICGKSYARPSTLKTHLRTHSGEKPYRCVDCNKSFSQAANLTAHVRTHSGEKPFRCPVCDRRFSQSSSVTTHMRTHSGERPYRCRLCRKAFSDSSTLTKHLRIHSGEKPYECKLCLLRFSQSGNLNRHMRVHGNNNMMPP